MSLTNGAIQQMFPMSGSSDNPSFLPAVQVLHLKKIEQARGSSEDRWKVSLALVYISVFVYVEVQQLLIDHISFLIADLRIS